VGLFVFNSASAILFTGVALFTDLHGILLWPAVILHGAIAAGGEQDSWMSNQGEELRALAIEEFRASLDIALTEISRGSDTAPSEFRNVRYFESDVPEMEHA
jgi:hypothetical protein